MTSGAGEPGSTDLTVIAGVRTKYPAWCLTFVDHIGYDILNESDQEHLRQLIQIDHHWDKIVLFNPSDPTKGFEL